MCLYDTRSKRWNPGILCILGSQDGREIKIDHIPPVTETVPIAAITTRPEFENLVRKFRQEPPNRDFRNSLFTALRPGLAAANHPKELLDDIVIACALFIADETSAAMKVAGVAQIGLLVSQDATRPWNKRGKLSPELEDEIKQWHGPDATTERRMMG